MRRGRGGGRGDGCPERPGADAAYRRSGRARDLAVWRHPGTEAPDEHRDARVFWNRTPKPPPPAWHARSTNRRKSDYRLSQCDARAEHRTIAVCCVCVRRHGCPFPHTAGMPVLVPRHLRNAGSRSCVIASVPRRRLTFAALLGAATGVVLVVLVAEPWQGPVCADAQAPASTPCDERRSWQWPELRTLTAASAVGAAGALVLVLPFAGRSRRTVGATRLPARASSRYRLPRSS